MNQICLVLYILACDSGKSGSHDLLGKYIFTLMQYRRAPNYCGTIFVDHATTTFRETNFTVHEECVYVSTHEATISREQISRLESNPRKLRKYALRKLLALYTVYLWLHPVAQ